jgi:glycosyltransferase involved in cell wall biosynthesis
MLRVLVAGFCAVPGPGRASVQLGHVIRALARRASVDVLAARRGEQPYVERRPRVRMLRVPIPDAPLGERAEAFRRALRRQLEGADYDLVHVRDGWTGSVVLELRSRLGYAVVFDAARGILADPGSVEPEELPALVDLESACVRQADLVLAPTEPARRYLASITRPERVCLVPPGVDVNQFDWDDPEPSGPPRILYLGPIAPGRGVRLLVRSMMEVARRCDARLVLAGPADARFRDRMLDSARALGIADRVEIPGEIAHDDAPDAIARATVCVAPSAVDLGASPTALFPTKLLDYMACRRPVVAARRSAATLLVRDGQTGLLFTPGDPADLAERLVALLTDVDLQSRLAEAGYEHVRRHYSASNTRRSLRRAYDGLAARPEWSERFARAATRAERLSGDELEAVGVLPMRRLEGEEELGGAETLADDITTVEAPSFESAEAHIDAGLIHGVIGDDTGEDWVVEDLLTREHAHGNLPATPPVPADHGDDEQTPPVESVFVAGELEIPSIVDIGGDEHTPFSAVSSLLGGGDETDQQPRPGPPRGTRGHDDD